MVYSQDYSKLLIFDISKNKQRLAIFESAQSNDEKSNIRQEKDLFNELFIHFIYELEQYY
jgi:hypothetical protein